MGFKTLSEDCGICGVWGLMNRLREKLETVVVRQTGLSENLDSV